MIKCTKIYNIYLCSDITKMATTKPSPNPRQSPAVEPPGPRQQQRKVQQKKKKKGGKW